MGIYFIHHCKTSTNYPSTSNPPVLHPEMVSTKVWSGLPALSARLVISKFGVVYHTSTRLHFPKLSYRTIETNVHTLNLSSTSIIGALISYNHSCLFKRSHFHKRRKGGYCTMNQARPVFLGCCIRMLSATGYSQGSFFSFFDLLACFWPRGRTTFPTSGLAILCFSMV